MRLDPKVIDMRVRYARSVQLDAALCSSKWGISCVAARQFIKTYCLGGEVIRKKPEYENQRLADLQVMTPNQWCEVWGIPRWEYKSFLKMYERQCGFIATPEIRAEWERQYWEKLEC